VVRLGSRLAVASATGRLDGQNVTRAKLTCELRRLFLAVEERAAGEARPPPSFPTRCHSPPLCDDRKAAFLKHSRFSDDPVAASEETVAT
jgi:hypothetical protein